VLVLDRAPSLQPAREVVALTGIRVSPHFYTLPEELTAFAETLSELRESRKWQDYVSLTASY